MYDNGENGVIRQTNMLIVDKYISANEASFSTSLVHPKTYISNLVQYYYRQYSYYLFILTEIIIFFGLKINFDI